MHVNIIVVLLLMHVLLLDLNTDFILIKLYNFFGTNSVSSNIVSSGIKEISVPFNFLLHFSILIFVLTLPFE